MSGADKTPATPLEALAAQADSLAPPLGEGQTDLDVAAAAGQGPVEPEQSNAEILAGAIQLVRDTVTQLADVHSIQHTLADPQTVQLGVLWGKVLDRYGVKLSAWMGEHADVVMATLATLAIGKNVLAGFRAEQAAKAKAAPTPAPSPEGGEAAA